MWYQLNCKPFACQAICSQLSAQMLKINMNANIQQEHLSVNVKRNTDTIGQKTLQDYNKYELMIRILKWVAVPALTFINEILCLNLEIVGSSEVNQMSEGRLAMGGHGTTSN